MHSSIDFKRQQSYGNQNARVTIHCPEKQDIPATLIRLPKSFQELLDIGSRKFELSVSKVLIKDGGLIDDIEVIRDGDHLILASDKYQYS